MKLIATIEDVLKERKEQYSYGVEYTDLIIVLHKKMYSLNEMFEIMLPLFRPMINRYVNRFYAIGEDKEDLYQQGMIGLFNAIKSYDFGVKKNFYFLARRCIKLSVLNLVRATQAKKYQLNSGAISLDAYRRIYPLQGKDINLYDVLESNEVNPEYKYILNEKNNEIFAKINVNLSKLELAVLSYYMDGFTYDETAKKIGIKPKTVDNALTRIKKKLKIIMSE